jgi:hypothetical protein
MHLPTAIRKDHNPLAVVALFGPTSPLAFLRWTSYICPHCGYIFRRDFWPNKVRLGKGERVCPRCFKVFDDGAREWPELSLLTKLHFYFPPLFVGIWGGLLLAAVISLFNGPRDEHSWPVVFVVSILPMLLWSLVRLLWVVRSNIRYKGDLRVRNS